MPKGATCVDFAYRVHSEVGDKMVGAIVNDSIVPFDYTLKTGDIIKVNTSKLSKGPNKDWLNFVVTSQARNKIKAFYTRREKNENLERGMAIFEKALRRKKMSLQETLDNYLNIILDSLKLKDLDELYIAIGQGKYTISAVMKLIGKKEEKTNKILNKTSEQKKAIIKNDILVEGMNEIKVSLSGCCKPIPGDNIIGYITKGSGITVHRSSCKNIIDLDERLINVKWNENLSKRFPTDLLIYTSPDDNLLDIITKASSNNIAIDSVYTITKNDFKIYVITILVENAEKLDKFCKELNNLKFIQKVERQMN